MNRLIGIAGALVVALLLLVPIALAAEPELATEHSLMTVGGDMTLASGDLVKNLVVVAGKATVEGAVDSLVIIDGDVVTKGATIGHVVAFSGTLELGSGTTVAKDVQVFGATVTTAPDATVGGTVGSFTTDWLAVGAALTVTWIVIYLGFVFTAMAFGLVLAGLAARQVRAAEDLISEQPGPVILSGILGLIVIPTVGVLAAITVIGAPFGIAILLGVFPVLLFVGYIVMGIWIGDRLRQRSSSEERRERPYVSALVGMAILAVIGIIPFLGGIVGLIGFGAVILLMWRTFTGRSALPTATIPAPAHQPG